MVWTTFREHDLWKECVSHFHLTPATYAPSHEDRSLWIFRVWIESEWVKGDPLMLQRMHEAAKPHEFVAMKRLRGLFDDYWKDIVESPDVDTRTLRLKVLSSLAGEVISDASAAAEERCRNIHREHKAVLLKYGWYQVKEGIGFGQKVISTGVSSALTALSFSAGPSGIAGGLMGLTGVVSNLLKLGNQIRDWCLEAEDIQKELRTRLQLLKTRYSGKVLGSKVAVNVQEFVEGVFWDTIGMGLDRNFGVTINAVGDLVDKYEDKLNGLEKGSHEMSKALDVLLLEAEQLSKEVNEDRGRTDDVLSRLPPVKPPKKPVPKSLVGYLNDLIYKLTTPSKVRAKHDWNFLKSQVYTSEERKLLRLERRVHLAIERTIALVARVREGRKNLLGYRHAMDGLESKKLKVLGVDATKFAAKVTTLFAWDLPQVFAFVDYGNLAAKDAQEVAQFVIDFTNTSMNPGVELANWIAEKTV